MNTLNPQQVTHLRQLTNQKSQFDAIVTFGYGPVLTGSTPGSYKLNVYGRINAIATGMLYQSHDITRIIPTGGKTGGLDQPSEAQLIARLLQSTFNIPESTLILEEEAMDTIFNIIHIANIIDQCPPLYKNLLFVAMGFHLPRIQEISSLLKLDGVFIAAEAVVKIRSLAHQRFLAKLLHSDNPSYIKLLLDQERGLRGIREIPEYWIPPLGALENPQRLREILSAHQVHSFLNSAYPDLTSLSTEQLLKSIRSIPRRFPN